jgi:hypothetical protein
MYFNSCEFLLYWIHVVQKDNYSQSMYKISILKNNNKEGFK